MSDTRSWDWSHLQGWFLLCMYICILFRLMILTVKLSWDTIMYMHETIKDYVIHYGVDAIGQSINDTCYYLSSL